MYYAVKQLFRLNGWLSILDPADYFTAYHLLALLQNSIGCGLELAWVTGSENMLIPYSYLLLCAFSAGKVGADFASKGNLQITHSSDKGE